MTARLSPIAPYWHGALGPNKIPSRRNKLNKFCTFAMSIAPNAQHRQENTGFAFLFDEFNPFGAARHADIEIAVRRENDPIDSLHGPGHIHRSDKFARRNFFLRNFVPADPDPDEAMKTKPSRTSFAAGDESLWQL